MKNTIIIEGKEYKLDGNLNSLKNILFRESGHFSHIELEKSAYFKIRDLAWQVQIKLGLSSLPTDILDVAHRLGYMTIKIHDSEPFLGKLLNYNELIKKEAFNCELWNEHIIFYNPNYYLPRVRFSIAHEIGHLLLEHNTNLSTDKIETEANAFAARLLMPVGVLHALGVKKYTDIMQFCQVSEPAAIKRMNRITELRERGKFFSSPLERQLLNNFKEFIELNRLT